MVPSSTAVFRGGGQNRFGWHKLDNAPAGWIQQVVGHTVEHLGIERRPHRGQEGVVERGGASGDDRPVRGDRVLAGVGVVKD